MYIKPVPAVTLVLLSVQLHLFSESLHSFSLPLASTLILLTAALQTLDLLQRARKIKLFQSVSRFPISSGLSCGKQKQLEQIQETLVALHLLVVKREADQPQTQSA